MAVSRIIFKILKTKTFSQSSLTIAATILNGILGLLFYMALARNLGPDAFGIFAVVVAVVSLIADIGDLGTSSGLIRFIGKYKNQKEKSLRFLKLALETKLLVWFLVVIIGFLITSWIVNSVLIKPQLLKPLQMAFLGVGGLLLLTFSNHGLQALQKYKIWSLLLVGSNLIRLLVIFLLLWSFSLNLTNGLLVYIIVPLIFFFISLIFLPKFMEVKGELTVSKEFFTFNKWIFLISLIAAFGSRLDTFLATRFLSIAEVGLYSVALQLTSFIPQLFFAIATVAAPKLAGFPSKGIAWNYLKKLQLFCLGLVVLGLLGIPLASIIINLFYGNDYQSSFTPFVILYIAQLIFLLALPSHQAIFYFFAKPQVFIPVSVVQLALTFILGTVLIPQYGISGAAITVLLGNIFLLLAPLLWVIYQFKKR